MSMEEKLNAVVVNCLTVPMYTRPEPGSSYMCDITCLSNVYAEEIGSKRFYRIILHDGLTGYCEKKYIAVRQEE